MKIEVSSTGFLKQYLPTPREMTLESEMSVRQLKEICGMDASIKCNFLINDRLVKGETLIRDGDRIVFLMLISAG